MKKKRNKTNLGQLIVRAFYWFDEGLQNNLQRKGSAFVTHSQSMIIMIIDDGITRPSAIADRLGVSRQAIHQSLRELISLDIVELVPDPQDGRAKLARLSKKGAPLQRRARKIMKELETELANRIGKRRAGALREALEQDWGDSVTLD